MIYLAPLQSYTNLFYIQAFSEYVGGVDKYFTPFYRANKNSSYDIENELIANDTHKLIPQVLCNNKALLLEFSKQMSTRYFDEINLNMGCPFPMVVNKNLGSGILPHPNIIKNMFDGFFAENTEMKLSIKIRLGKENNAELESLIDILNDYPFTEIIIHPRLGIQKYKGNPDWDTFASYQDKFNCPLVGNGDINSYEELLNIESIFPWSSAWMLGRGLLSNPFIMQKVTYGSMEYWTKLLEFHQCFSRIINHLNDVQKLNLLKVFWEYPLVATSEGKRLHRKLRKLGVYADYSNWYKTLQLTFLQ